MFPEVVESVGDLVQAALTQFCVVFVAVPSQGGFVCTALAVLFLVKPLLQAHSSVILIIIIIIIVRVGVVSTEPQQELGEEAQGQQEGDDDVELAGDLVVMEIIGGGSEGPEMGDLGLGDSYDEGRILKPKICFNGEL